MKIKTLVLAGIMASAVASQATLIVGDWTVIDDSFADDGAGTFSTTGIWESNGGEPGSWGGSGDFLYDGGAAAGESATWTFLGLTPGEYTVAASWAHHSNRTPLAPFTVQSLAMPPVSMEVPAIGGPLPGGVTLLDPASANVNFQVLTMTAVVTGTGTLTVTLNDIVNGGSDYVTADAVAIMAVVPEPSSLALLGFGLGLTLVARRRILS